MIIDMHVHTTFGSSDSSLTPRELVEAARLAGIDGVVVAEHIAQWPDGMPDGLCAGSGLVLIPAAEWSCEYGHVLVLGVAPGVKFTGPLQEMRRIVDREGGYLILAHPFRYFPGPMSLLFGRRPRAAELTVEQLATHPAFALVDAIEVLNNGCTDRENRLAAAVASTLGKQAVAGSDAHGRDEVGRCVTVFEERPPSIAALLERLRGGPLQTARHHGASGATQPFDLAPA